MRIYAGRFEAHAALKSGQGITTWEGRDRADGSPVILKTSAAGEVSPGTRLRLAREARILQELHHPRVVPLKACGQEGEELFLVMPRLAGTTLEERLRQGPLGVDEALTLALAYLEGLQHVHVHDVLHRDLKPANLLVDPPVLLDFGLARSGRPRASWGSVGTIRYLSPEQAGVLRRPVSERSDLYSLGMVLHEALAGSLATEPDTGSWLRSLVTRRPRPLREVRADVPVALDSILQRMLRADPRERYQSAASVCHDLAALRSARAEGQEDPQLPIGATDRRAQLAEPALVGRSSELEWLSAGFRAAQEGRGGLQVLLADSGLGKSRLLEELQTWVLGQGGRVLWGQARTQSADVPFQLFEALLEDLLPEWDELGLAADERLAPLARAFPAFAARLPADDHFAREGPEPILAGLLALFEGLGKDARPTLVLLDDAQWADRLTLDFLSRWRGGAHLAIVAAARPGPLAGHRELAPLSAPDLEELLASMAGPLPPAAVAAVTAAVEGNPFLAEAMLRGLVESGQLLLGPEGWQLDPGRPLEVQASERVGVQLGRRMQELPAATLELLTHGAVVGRTFSLEGDFTEARRRNLIWGDDPYTFTHDRIRETLLERLDPAERRRLHQLEAARRPAHDCFGLAYHLEQSGDLAAACPHALRAARQARERWFHELARKHYELALRGAALQPGDEFEVRRALTELCVIGGDYQQARRYCEEARSRAGGLRERLELEVLLGMVGGLNEDPELAQEAVERALALLGERFPSTAVALGQSLALMAYYGLRARGLPFRWPASERLRSLGLTPAELGRALHNLLASFSSACNMRHVGTGSRVRLLWASIYGLLLLESLPPGPEAAPMRANVALMFTLLGDRRASEHWVQEALREAASDARARSETCNRAGLIVAFQGRLQESLRFTREAHGQHRGLETNWERAAGLATQCATLYHLGQLKEAVQVARRLTSLPGAGPTLAGVAHRVLACIVPDEVDEAQLERQLAEVGPWDGAFPQLTAALGAVRLLGGRLESAVEIFAEGTRHALVQPFGHMTSTLPAWLATALRLQALALPPGSGGRREELLRKARRAARQALKVGARGRPSLPHALRESALLAFERGHEARGRQLLEESLSEARRQDAAVELAWTELEWGRLGEARGWPQARATYERGRGELGRRGARVPGYTLSAPENAESHSLLARYEGLLEHGRRLVSSPTEEEVCARLADAARELLPGQVCTVLRAGEWDRAPRGCRSLVEEAAASGRTVTFVEGSDQAADSLLEAALRSVLCSPVQVLGQTEACLLVTHSHVGGLFEGEDRRLGHFLASLAGAAFENLRGVARFGRLFNEIGVGLAVLDQRGKVLEANPFLLQMLPQVLGTNLEDCFYHEDRRQFRDFLHGPGERFELEARVHRAERVMWTAVLGARLTGEQDWRTLISMADMTPHRLEQVVRFQEMERRLLATELHDAVAQPVAALSMMLQAFPDDKLRRVTDYCQELAQDVGRLMADLRSPVLAGMDGLEAVEGLLSAQPDVRYRGPSTRPPITGVVGLFLFRIVAEALHNAQRHALARRVAVSLEVAEGEVVCEVEDDGQGFDPAPLLARRQVTRHFGLAGMKERAELLGGTFELESAPGQGTRLRVRLPLA